MSCWFVEEADHFGRWVPALYHGDRPSRKKPETSGKKWRAEPVAVPAFLIGRDLRHIRSVLSPDGEFYGIDLEAVAAFLREGVSDDFKSSINGGKG